MIPFEHPKIKHPIFVPPVVTTNDMLRPMSAYSLLALKEIAKKHGIPLFERDGKKQVFYKKEKLYNILDCYIKNSLKKN